MPDEIRIPGPNPARFAADAAADLASLPESLFAAGPGLVLLGTPRMGHGASTLLAGCAARVGPTRARREPLDILTDSITAPTPTFAEALAAFLANDPDAIFLDDVRTAEAMQAAVDAAREKLVFTVIAGMGSICDTIDLIAVAAQLHADLIHVIYQTTQFAPPPDRARTGIEPGPEDLDEAWAEAGDITAFRRSAELIADVFRGAVFQVLCHDARDARRRTPCREVLVGTAETAAAIRWSNPEDLDLILRMGRDGSRSLSAELDDAVAEGRITAETAEGLRPPDH